MQSVSFKFFYIIKIDAKEQVLSQPIIDLAQDVEDKEKVCLEIVDYVMIFAM